MQVEYFRNLHSKPSIPSARAPDVEPEQVPDEHLKKGLLLYDYFTICDLTKCLHRIHFIKHMVQTSVLK